MYALLMRGSTRRSERDTNLDERSSRLGGWKLAGLPSLDDYIMMVLYTFLTDGRQVNFGITHIVILLPSQSLNSSIELSMYHLGQTQEEGRRYENTSSLQTIHRRLYF